MALPQQLKTARMDNTTVGSTIDNNVGALEQALADILGITVDVDVTASALSIDNSGRITKSLVLQKAAGPVGWRFRDSTSNKEVRLAVSGTDFVIDENTGSEAVPVWTNRFTMAIATGAMTGALATTSRMGLCPQGDSNAAHFLDGTMAWSTPSAATVPVCRVRNSANLAIANATNTALTFNTEDIDTDTMHSTVSNTGRITATTAGKYYVVANVLWAANAVGRRQIILQKNGTAFVESDTDALSSATAMGQICAGVVDLAAADYITVQVYQNSGGSLNITAAASYSPTFAAYKVG